MTRRRFGPVTTPRLRCDAGSDNSRSVVTLPRISHRRLILASGSPRRRSLLAAVGLDFEVAESGVEENRAPDEGATDFARRMALEKALAVSVRTPDALILGADTVVECEGEILGKPRGPDDARRMLRMLSGRTHRVVTAFALAAGGEPIEARVVTSLVRFRPLSESEIEAYLLTGEPFDKAGSYGIQGDGAGFITEVEGARDNVMGLPVHEVIEALARSGVNASQAVK